MYTWNRLAVQKLSRRVSTDGLRIAIIGIGYEYGGDDAAGSKVAQLLIEAVGRNRPDLFVIDAGVAPENFTSVIRRFAPETVLLIDAAQMGEPPGTIAWLDWRETSGMTAATHGLPPYMLAKYLSSEIGCEIYLIGIQPSGNQFDTQISDVVLMAIKEVSRTLANLVIIPGNDPDCSDKPLAV